MTDNFIRTVLVRRDQFRKEAFRKVSAAADKVIQKAKASDVLALTVTMNSPLKVVSACLYDESVFESILKS